MVWTCDEEIRLGVLNGGSRMETYRAETKRTLNESMAKWNKEELRETRHIEPGRTSTKEWTDVSVAAKTHEKL